MGFWDTAEMKSGHLSIAAGGKEQTIAALGALPLKKGTDPVGVFYAFTVFFDCTLEKSAIHARPKFGVSNPYIAPGIAPGGDFPLDPFFGVGHDESDCVFPPGGIYPVTITRLDVIDPALTGMGSNHNYPKPTNPWALKNQAAHVTGGVINNSGRPIFISAFYLKGFAFKALI